MVRSKKGATALMEGKRMAKTLRDMAYQYERGQYSFSHFLGLAERSDMYRELQEWETLPWEFFGGMEDCERVVLRIGSEDSLGYDMPYPIALVKIAPKNAKFADELGHRDFLGSILSLGLERDSIGDIFVEDNIGYVFCLDTVAAYLVENLERVRHTAVNCKILDEVPALKSTEPEEKTVQAASYRIDLVLAKVYNLSRGNASELFPEKKIFVDGRLCEDPGRELKPGELVSVRGFGRFRIREELGLSRKGKHNLAVEVTPR